MVPYRPLLKIAAYLCLPKRSALPAARAAGGSGHQRRAPGERVPPARGRVRRSRRPVDRRCGGAPATRLPHAQSDAGAGARPAHGRGVSGLRPAVHRLPSPAQ